ncbi:TetR family transcriptional regulator [Luteipulveratus halotolerans]|uniref:TetR family transcriptional regulator n=1 Tax=Luteipulveratus halotolerans TaxID=1631356 RepID=UPI0018D11667|nr:TetR family transcriptional regulator [Luteipulveratus halotolerans]
MSARVKSDRRTTRWDEHREQRRTELIEAAVRTIDRLGPDASIAEMAQEAKASKPVLYRYFADKNELHAAVASWASARVTDQMLPALTRPGAMRDRVADAVDAYLRVIEEHPQVFQLLIHHRGEGDILATEKDSIAAALAVLMGDTFRRLDLDAAGAEPWAHGLVGLGLSTGEWWLERRSMSRTAVGRYLSQLIWHAFAGIIEESGGSLADLDHISTPPTVVPLQEVRDDA